MRQQVGDQLEAFIGRVRRRRQAEVDQRKRRRVAQLPQELDGMLRLSQACTA